MPDNRSKYLGHTHKIPALRKLAIEYLTRTLIGPNNLRYKSLTLRF